MQTLWQDLRHGVRLLGRSPGFTAIAIAALAIGIGANTAIFSVVNALLIRDLPYKEADRLAIIWEHNIPRDRKNNVVAPANFLHWRDLQQTFEDLGGASGMVGLTFKSTITGTGDPEEVPIQLVSASFFPVLGVQPAMGRTFTEEETKPNSRVVVLTDKLWRRKYGADPGMTQRSIVVDGVPYNVIGVMPPEFFYLDKTIELYLPLPITAQMRNPAGRWMNVVGRLKPGVTFEQAQSDMTRVHQELTRQFPNFNTGWTARVVPMREELTGTVRPALLVLLGAVAFVLLIACTNVANLLLARATARQRELAIRAALGAGRGRIIRQLIAEALVLALAGGAAGLLVAWWAVNLLRAAVAEKVPIQRLDTVSIDGSVLAFTLVASVVSGVIFGLIPALTASGSILTDALKEGGRSGSAARGNRTRSVFVVAEIALALVLLVGAGLLIRSFLEVLHTNPGFKPDQIVTMDVSLPSARYPKPPQRVDFYRRLLERAAALPGVDSAGAISFLPLAGAGAATAYDVVGAPKPPAGEEPVCDVRVATNGYYQAMGIPLVKGRWFNEGDANDLANGIIVSESLARKHWPNEDPIGKRINVAWNDRRDDVIIGVVGDVHLLNLETAPRPTIYWPHARFPYNGMTLTVRAEGDPRAIVNSVVGIVREQDPQLAVADIRTMEQVVNDSVAERRLTTMMLAIFAGAALLLAAVGIYGVIAYSVTQRTQEIGIRMALGAQRTHVLGMIVGRAMVLAFIGIAIGAGGAFLLTRMMEKLLFNVRPADPLTFAGVAGILALVSLAASYIPGLRATRVDPVVALRSE